MAPRKRKASGDGSTLQATKKRVSIIQAPFKLLKLPTDILHDVSCGYLESLDFFNLRLTCRQMRDETFQAFGIRYFKNVKFMLSPHSLEGLQAISKCQPLAPFIRHIDIGTGRLEANITKAFAPHWKSTDKWYRKYEEKYKRALHAQECMERDGTDMKILIEVMKSLPNLDSIGVGGHYIATSKAIHALNAGMQSWGAEYLIRELGAGATYDGARGLSRTLQIREPEVRQAPSRWGIFRKDGSGYHAFELVIEAFQKVAKPNLKLDFRVQQSFSTSRLPFSMETADTQAALQRIRALTIDLDVWLVDTRTWDHWVDQLFRSATSATSVHLCNTSFYAGDSSRKYSITKLMSSDLHPHLTTLKLDNIQTDVEVLTTMMKELESSLQNLILHRILIRDDRLVTKSSQNLWSDKWATFFEVLRGLPKLQSLSLSRLSEERGSRHAYRSQEDEIIEMLGLGKSSKKARATHPEEQRRRCRDWVGGIKLRGRRQIVDVLCEAAGDEEYIHLIGSSWVGDKKFRPDLPGAFPWELYWIPD